MGLNISKGNMYEFITHTWNTVKGVCLHDCQYCYMKRWGKLNPVRFDEKELKTNLGKDNFIFVGSSCDMWANDISDEWIEKTLMHCDKHENKYFFQTKNTLRFEGYSFPSNYEFCTTIETNRVYKEFMGKTILPDERALYLPLNSFITIEPIMDFDVIPFLNILSLAKPKQINLGADSGNNRLPEPTKEKILELIEGLNEFTTVVNKKNLARILNA